MNRLSLRTTHILAVLFALVGMMLLSACEDEADEPEQPQSTLFEWNRSPDTIIFRMDQIVPSASPIETRNAIPVCTLWGDGRLVLLTEGDNEEVVTEAFLSEDQMRSFIEDVIGTGFYGWEDDLISPNIAHPVRESIVLNLYSEVRKVERFSDWPADGFARLLDLCNSVSQQRQVVIPEGGWLTAYNVPVDNRMPNVNWAWRSEVVESLFELAADGNPVWIEGPLVEVIWSLIRQDGRIQFREIHDGQLYAYRVTLTVPNVSRDSLPAPENGN